MKTFLLVMCYLAVAHGWTCREAPRLLDAVQVDAGHGKVVARDMHNIPYFLSGASWYKLGSLELKHVSVGPSGLWGIDMEDQVVKYIAGNFQQVRGLSLKQVDAGGDGHVIGIAASADEAYCLPRDSALAFNGVGALNWTKVPEYLRYCSCSPNHGCWGLDSELQVKFSKGINSSSCVFHSWTRMSGLDMTMMKAATDGRVFGVATNGYAYEGTGISSNYPHGTGWSIVSQCFFKVTSLSYDLGQLWLVTNSGLLLQCTK